MLYNSIITLHILSFQTLTDEVEPFSLDENFDYDNVILTPKFTTQEMTYLNSFIPQKKELT